MIKYYMHSQIEEKETRIKLLKEDLDKEVAKNKDLSTRLNEDKT